MTDPFSFVELLMLCMRTGWGSGVVSSWCFCMKLQFMNILVAPESRSADVEMDAREVSLTWTLREQCQGMSKIRGVLDVWVPVELQWIYEGPLKGNMSLLNA